MVYSNDKIHMCLHTKQPSNHKQTHHMITTSVSCDLVLQTMSMCVCVCLCQSMPDLGNHCQSGPPCQGKGQMEIMCSFPFPPQHQESSLSPWTLLLYNRSFKLQGCYKLLVVASGHREGAPVTEYLPTYSAVPTRFRIF